MSKKLNKGEIEVYRNYHAPSCGNYTTVKLDAVLINTHNSYAHELKKFEICWEIKKGEQHFICEAERNKKKGEVARRIDIVNISNGDEIEIETDKKIKKDGAITVYLK